MADDLLNGSDYCAVRRLSTGDDETLADVGEVCTRVPVESLPWLLAEGAIEPVTAAGDRALQVLAAVLSPADEAV